VRYDWVSFTTDYGTTDGFVAACKGVLAARAPAVRVIDVTHQVPPQDVRRGAAVLAQTAPWLPPAVHLAVVDPGVGTDRRGIAIVTARGILVGPDNGLLPPAADALGGSTGAYELADPAHHLPRVSTTFHGRDVFAPVAARLCLGLDPAALGPPVHDPVRLPEPAAHTAPGELRAQVLTVDGFGNVQLAAGAADLAAAQLGGTVGIAVGDATHPARTGRTFAAVETGELVVIVDSEDLVGIAVNRGHAAARLGVGPGDEVTVTAAPGR
jgi:S-adenosyl-L-methionine hydrolase (adenosine-forming)